MSNPHERQTNVKRVLVDDKTYNVLAIRDGGMGRVWLLELAFKETFDPIYRSRIAVKTFDLAADDTDAERELNIWISLSHPSILPLLKIGRLNYKLAAIMNLQVGSLDDLLEDRRSLGAMESARITLAIAEALDYAWTTFGILHLDLKPSNVLLEDLSGKHIRVADWGIARLIKAKVEETTGRAHAELANSHKTLSPAGTPIYMSPERFSGNWSLTPAADIYSLGLMAIQLATGVLPFRFDRENPIEEIVAGDLLGNSAVLLSDYPDEFQRFCLNCIHPMAANRFDSYKEVLRQLKSILRKG